MKYTVVVICLLAQFSTAEEITVEPEMLHIRNGETREWTDFAAGPCPQQLEREFDGKSNNAPATLSMVQQDVKQFWDVQINGTKLGQLHRDENSIEGYWEIPAGTLRDGLNQIVVSTTSKTSDDIRLGRIRILQQSVSSTLSASTIRVEVRDEDSGMLTPCRISIIRDGSLVSTAETSTNEMAVRPGVIYCRGAAVFRLPPGKVRIVAGRGPEFSIDSRELTVATGDVTDLRLNIRREVETPGYVSSDTHVHTLTHSGHGDASVHERMLTLAGECVELPVATDHNRHIDYRQLAQELRVDRYFTPLIGNEFTTSIGHFNVFPVESSSTPVPDHTAQAWPELFGNVFRTPNVKVVILNHARDIHRSYRPFGPAHFLAPVARNTDDWNLRANAMEIVNSAAQQSDMMQLVHDWMANLCAGRRLIPVGSSDSHDVARHFVGQGRTLIRCPDNNAGEIDTEHAVRSFLKGHVTVSCGLTAAIRVFPVDNTNRDQPNFGPGDTVPAAREYRVEVDAMGPSWMAAHEVELFRNGRSVGRHSVDAARRQLPGIKQTLTFSLPGQSYDSFVTAVVRGPGVTQLYWPIAKPYQPTSPDWSPEFMAVTGAVWIDADGDHKITSARAYAKRLCETTGYSINEVLDTLKHYDTATALHVADEFYRHDKDAFTSSVLPAAHRSESFISEAFDTFMEAIRECQRAKVAVQ